MTSAARRLSAVVALFIVITAVSLPFIYVEFHPTIYAEIILVAVDDRGSGVHIEQPLIPLCRVDGEGVATFLFRARIEHPYSDRFMLKIFPNGESKWFSQPHCCTVSTGIISGQAQLGSREYPLTEPSDYTFQLEDAAAEPVITGRITTRIHRYAEGPWRATAILGILASVAQLVTLWRNPNDSSVHKVDHEKKRITKV